MWLLLIHQTTFRPIVLRTGFFEVIPDVESLIAEIALGYGATESTAHPQKKGIEHFCHVEGLMPD